MFMGTEWPSGLRRRFGHVPLPVRISNEHISGGNIYKTVLSR